MPREVKELMVKELEDRFQDVQQTGCVLVDYQGIDADRVRKLRGEVRRQGVQMTVVKNSLFGLAMARLGVGQLASLLKGPIAVLKGEDPVSAARSAKELTRASDAVKIRGAYVDGKVLGPDEVEKLARIPSREVLLAMVAGAVMDPLRRLAAGLLAKPRDLLSVLTQLKDSSPS